jgi:hypothetical protein
MKKSSGQILFLVFLLITIIAIMIVLKTDKIGFQPSPIPEFDEEAKIIDGKYYNKRYNFGIALPNTNWEISNQQNIDSLFAQDSSLSLIENINILAKLNRRDKLDTLSIVHIGIIPLNEPRTPVSLAKQSLLETKHHFFLQDTVRVLSDVTLTGMSKLRGAYYMVELPEQSQTKYPVRLNMFLVQNRFCYTVTCQVKAEEYDFLRTDLEDILKSFRIFGG